jgi:iron uptake system component EfeO
MKTIEKPKVISTTFALGGAIALAATLGACDGSTPDPDKAATAMAMQSALKADLMNLYSAAQELQAAAPMPTGRGWDATMDAKAIADMKTAWIKARTAYEHVEGATAPIFGDIDVAIDQRYDGFMEELGDAGDADLFDDKGVTGMHAIERILYVDTTPAGVVDIEKTLKGYVAAAWPKTEAEAASFKTKLAGQLVIDTKALLDGWTMAEKIDISGAFQGLIGLVNEQQEKVNLAATNAEESRYSQRTLADLRANLEGTASIYGLFRDWLKKKPSVNSGPSGADVDGEITAGLAALGTLYDGIQGDAIPAPPATWSAETPSAADLASPFGVLYTKVRDAVDMGQDGSLVNHMNEGAKLLGIPGFTEE